MRAKLLAGALAVASLGLVGAPAIAGAQPVAQSAGPSASVPCTGIDISLVFFSYCIPL